MSDSTIKTNLSAITFDHYPVGLDAKLALNQIRMGFLNLFASIFVSP